MRKTIRILDFFRMIIQAITRITAWPRQAIRHPSPTGPKEAQQALNTLRQQRDPMRLGAQDLSCQRAT